MNEAPEDLHHWPDQLRMLATETTDPLAERLVWDMIAELEGRLRADLLQSKRVDSDDADRSQAKLLAALIAHYSTF